MKIEFKKLAEAFGLTVFLFVIVFLTLCVFEVIEAIFGTGVAALSGIATLFIAFIIYIYLRLLEKEEARKIK